MLLFAIILINLQVIIPAAGVLTPLCELTAVLILKLLKINTNKFNNLEKLPVTGYERQKELTTFDKPEMKQIVIEVGIAIDLLPRAISSCVGFII